MKEAQILACHVPVDCILSGLSFNDGDGGIGGKALQSMAQRWAEPGQNRPAGCKLAAQGLLKTPQRNIAVTFRVLALNSFLAAGASVAITILRFGAFLKRYGGTRHGSNAHVKSS